MMETKDVGLRGIPVADTRISAVDGEKGKLIYRGYDIDELARYSTFEETVYLMLYETLPTRKELEPYLRKIIGFIGQDLMFYCPPHSIFTNKYPLRVLSL